jgi:Tol biopolymer transport system component
VLYTAADDPMVPGDTNNQLDVFMLDRNTTTVIPISVNGAVWGNGESDDASCSNDGRYVAFVSNANNFGTVAPSGRGLYVKDRNTGTFSLLASDVHSNYPARMSGNGRFVTYTNATGNSSILVVAR